MDFEKLRAEEAELEKLLYRQDEDETKTDDESPSDEVQVRDEDFEDFESTGHVTTQDNEDPKPSSDKQTRVSWKKRYASYKASTDNTLFELRKENAALKNIIATKNEEISRNKEVVNALKSEIKSKVDPFEGVISQEEEDLIGPEAVDIIKKVAATRTEDTSKYDDLQAKIDALEKEANNKLKAEAENFQNTSMAELKVKLATIIPDWSTIDTEPKFVDFMNEADELSGVPRQTLFVTAVQNRDIERVASFYKLYKSLKPKSKQEILAGKVTPTGTGSGSNGNDTGKHESSERLYTLGEYTEFMDSVARGDYRGTKELRLLAKKKERQFDQALVDGRVR